MNSRPKKILLVSPFPPSQNPRLLKEYQVLKKEGFQVKVLYAERDLWSSNHKVLEDFERVGGKVGSLWHFTTRIIHKLSKILLPYEYSYHRVSLLLLHKALKIKADIYIGHELTSLPIVVKAARKYKAKSGFDIEDFHRNETSNDINSYQYLAACTIEDKYICQTNYITCASPLIGERYQKIYPKIKPYLINNVFSSIHINEQTISINKTLNLFWFSQTVGKGRGIELVMESMAKLTDFSIKLTLLGNVDEITEEYFFELAKKFGLAKGQLIFLAPVEPERIFEIARQNDIGLALEVKTPENRNLCLTNKIFTYMNAGLAILASNTQAQEKLLLEYPNMGITFNSENIDSLTASIENYCKYPELLHQHKQRAKQVAKNQLNWELESQKFISLVNSTL